MITVHVCSERDGKPLKNARIRVAYYTPLPCHDAGHTNNNGDFNANVNPPCDGSIHVNGKEVYKGNLSGRIVVYG
jgi:hypothetical protein